MAKKKSPKLHESIKKKNYVSVLCWQREIVENKHSSQKEKTQQSTIITHAIGQFLMTYDNAGKNHLSKDI
jgi:uncharacterized protein YpiB (UPF0302 family)